MVTWRLVSSWLGTLGKHNCRLAARRGSPVGVAATESRGNVSRKKKNKETVDHIGEASASGESSRDEAASTERVETSGWVDHQVNTQRREFPNDGQIDEALRIAFTDDAHAEIVAHAKDDLGRELCGVLLGTVCEDSRGLWVSAEVALRGETDKQGGTHVTYTHETWEKIYEQKDKKYPKLAILGWYHTHPGFGVQFSEMDLFIQRNFFPGDTQFALVIDPVGGDEAIVANTMNETQYVSRFWVDGKERKGKVPRGEAPAEQPTQHDAAISAALDDRLTDVEQRLAQVLQSTESQREAHGRLFLTFGFLCVVLVAGFIGYMLYDNYRTEHSPPKDLEMVNVPVRINGKVMLIGMQVKGWEIPDSEDLLKTIEGEAEQRAFRRALKSLMAMEGQGGELPEELTDSMLSPTVTYYWAIGASVLALGLLAFQLFPKRERSTQR